MSRDERSIVIVGGGAGIGEAIAHAFASLGGKVVIADINEAEAELVAGAIRSQGGSARSVRCDMTSDADLANVREFAEATFGLPDILLNIAVHYPSTLGSADNIDMARWQRALDVNVLGYVRAVRAFLPAMLQRGSGTIVNTSSTIAVLPDASMPILLPYATVKHALFGFTTALAVALKPRGIDVRVFCPTATATRNASNPALLPEEFSFLKDVLQDSIAKGATPDSAANVFMDGLRGDEFLICAHPNFEERIVRYAQNRLNPWDSY